MRKSPAKCILLYIHRSLQIFTNQSPELRRSSIIPQFHRFSTVIGAGEDDEEIARSISNELLKCTSSDSSSVRDLLDLRFSHITPSPPVILSTLNLCPEAGRAAMEFLEWISEKPNPPINDEVISFFVNYFGRRKDFKAVDSVISMRGGGVAGDMCYAAFVDRLVRAGRVTKAVGLFNRMEEDYGFKRSTDSLKVVVSKLCEYGYGRHAEDMVKELSSEFFPDQNICDMLIQGWCVDEKLGHAWRLAQEMYRGGFEIGVSAYNALLECICKLSRKKNPYMIDVETAKMLAEMDAAGVPRDAGTFAILVRHLCRLRRTDDAISVAEGMGEWGCSPDPEIFIDLIRSLYQAARVEEGDEMIDRMKSAGFSDRLDIKTYFGFLKILCGVQRVDHALSVFEMMKRDGCRPGFKTYDLLMAKLCAHGRFRRANGLYREAGNRGVPVEPKAYPVDPWLTKKKEEEEEKNKVKKKKRETLSEKKARKRKRLKKLRLSFVKKPIRGRRSYA